MDYGLYVITDERLSRGLTHAEIARRAVAGGADVIQLRDKRCDCAYLHWCAAEIRGIADAADVPFIVNDRLDVAMHAGADGVHLGREDTPLRFARRLAPKLIIGASAGTLEEAREAERDGADYVGLGPIYPTASKDDAGEACGPNLIREVKAHLSIPVVAIGGISERNAAEALAAGADGVAVISAVVGQEDVTAAARRLKDIVVSCRRKA